MDVELTQSGEGAVLALSGELTIYTVSQCRAEITQCIAKIKRAVRVSLAGVTEIDGAGIQLLMFFKKHRINGDEFIIADLSADVQTVADLLQLDWLADAEK